ncbi:MAG: indole-3-glycerol phosphate synthase TrpC [Deltaproteobacteria bacterium]|nr:indole-3-glycerol phosphate synthase TrpC [Deltaproteobacteria bacterium]
MDILTRIVARKKEEIEAAQRREPLDRLREAATHRHDQRSFYDALKQPGPRGANIIAEIKRASPSKGPLRIDLDPADLARAYAAGGAVALSVLTDRDFFQGNPEDLRTARNAVPLPVLRKDFLINDYQIYASSAMGADAVLLICRILSRRQLTDLLALSRSLGMDALVEIHTMEDLEMAQTCGARLIGINNRNLATFETDIRTAMVMAKQLSAGQIPVAASGIAGIEDVEANLAQGVFNFLIGESLVRSDNPSARLASLLPLPPGP